MNKKSKSVKRRVLMQRRQKIQGKEIHCEFTSIWDTGASVTTPCLYNSNTGEVTPEVSKAEPPSGALLREYITMADGDELEVCPTCHEYVLKPVMNPDGDGNPTEDTECPNPDCEEFYEN